MSDITDMLATMIIDGNLDYCTAISKRADLKAGIDESLTKKEHPELIRTDCPVKK